jgi:hypothetical protein
MGCIHWRKNGKPCLCVYLVKKSSGYNNPVDLGGACMVDVRRKSTIKVRDRKEERRRTQAY